MVIMGCRARIPQNYGAINSTPPRSGGSGSGGQDNVDEPQDNVGDPAQKSEDYFDTKAFCVAYSWGLLLAFPLVCIVAVFHVLPIISFGLISELVGTIEIFLILLSLLITYKVFTLNEPDIFRFLRKVRDTFITYRSGRTESNINPDITDIENVDEVEAAASLVGELAEVVVHKLSRELASSPGSGDKATSPDPGDKATRE